MLSATANIKNELNPKVVSFLVWNTSDTIMNGKKFLWNKARLRQLFTVKQKTIIISITKPYILTTKLPITTVARKNGTQTSDATHIQSHIDSIHSPHKTRNTIMKLCMKSTKFQRGKSLSGNLSLLSVNMSM